MEKDYFSPFLRGCFCVVYALTLPAITLEGKTICGMEEHTHTEECYQDDKLICDKEEH